MAAKAATRVAREVAAMEEVATVGIEVVEARAEAARAVAMVVMAMVVVMVGDSLAALMVVVAWAAELVEVIVAAEAVMVVVREGEVTEGMDQPVTHTAGMKRL